MTYRWNPELDRQEIEWLREENRKVSYQLIEAQDRLEKVTEQRDQLAKHARKLRSLMSDATAACKLADETLADIGRTA